MCVDESTMKVWATTAAGNHSDDKLLQGMRTYLHDTVSLDCLYKDRLPVSETMHINSLRLLPQLKFNDKDVASKLVPNACGNSHSLLKPSTRSK